MTLEEKFNAKKAKQIRQDLGLSVIELAKQLNEKRGKYSKYSSVESTLHAYESGKREPKINPTSTSWMGMDYLLWLKEHNYNPCGI